MQRGAEKQIMALADTAHGLALDSLDEMARQTFRDNARLTAALALHVEEAGSMRAANARLQVRVRDLQHAASEQAALASEGVARADRANRDAQLLRDKVQLLEASLSRVARESVEERTQRVSAAAAAAAAAEAESEVLRRALEVRAAEARRIKRLARNLLDQRSEVEQFFIESLQLVKTEAAASREAYHRESRATFARSMREGGEGGVLPSIRTFGRGASRHSTNSVFDDFEGADALPLPGADVDLAALTWEQRERVLRLLFARINRAAAAPSSPAGHLEGPAPALHGGNVRALQLAHGSCSSSVPQSSAATGRWDKLPSLSGAVPGT